MEVSVVIPHMNQPEHLARCLEALSAQTYNMAEVEILVVDNGSRRLPRDVVANHKSVRLLEQPVPGPGPARNLGAAMSSAPLLAFIDADCLPRPDWLDTAVARFAANPALEILGGRVTIPFRDVARPTPLEAYERVYAFRQKHYIEKKGFSGAGNLFVKREVFEAVGPFGGIETAEDTDWGKRAGAQGHHTVYAPEVVVFHPARASLADLQRKWDRNISHHYRQNALARGWLGILRWWAATAAIALSPVIEVPRLVRELPNWPARLGAFRVLTGIRAYRARRMLATALNPSVRDASRQWNRQ